MVTATLSSTLQTLKARLFDLNLKDQCQLDMFFKSLRGHIPEFSSEFSLSMMEETEKGRFVV